MGGGAGGAEGVGGRGRHHQTAPSPRGDRERGLPHLPRCYRDGGEGGGGLPQGLRLEVTVDKGHSIRDVQ
jgi:hypothetical protein